MKWLFPLLLVSICFVPQGSAQQTVDIVVSFDPASINSTRILVSGITENLILSVGDMEIQVTNGVADFETNVFNLGETMSLTFNEETFSWSIPSSEFIHVQHVYSRWVGGQPPPIDNVGLGQGAVLTLNKLTANTEMNASRLGEKVVNTLLGSETDLNDDGAIETPIDPFGLLQFIFGMRDHLELAGVTPDVDPDFAQNVSAVLPLFDQLVDKPTYSEFLPNLNTSETLMGKLYQVAFGLATHSGTQTIETLNSLLEDSFQLTNSIFLQPREHTFGNTVTVSIQDDGNSATSTENTTAFPFLLFIPLLLLIRRQNRN
ncbi:MAG: hypothetical protein D6732_05325 [Methanobacteriota archaeon]|nr:MAG: hypothetical protein D6732_05325 [Euryarchaeota archaeon]